MESTDGRRTPAREESSLDFARLSTRLVHFSRNPTEPPMHSPGVMLNLRERANVARIALVAPTVSIAATRR